MQVLLLHSCIHRWWVNFMGEKECRGMVSKQPILDKQCPALKAALSFYDDYVSPI
jgi:hypothetical protein